MSGDVQPRKRKDRKRKKDDLAVEEPRGTAAALGEGDVFMHSPHDHDTGGHWCAKIIFFALLAVLMTLIGLIILENRGLSELEANAVESRYSGVLDGWLEDAPSDNHHDEHTLELKHHDDNEDEHDDHDIGENEEDNESNEADELEHSEEDENGHDSEMQDEDEVEEEYFRKTYAEDQLAYDDQDNDSNYEDDDDNSPKFNEEENIEDDANNSIEKETQDETTNYDSSYNDEYERVLKSTEQDDEDDDDDFEEEKITNDISSSVVKNSDLNDNEDDDDHDDDEDEHEEEEIENIEREVSEEEPLSLELPVLPEKGDDDDDDADDAGDDNKDDDDNDDSKEDDNGKDGGDDSDVEEEFLEPDDDDDEVPVEKITAPSGQPFDEIEDDVSTEKPRNTLEEEEEYEKRQEELRREEEQQSSHMWMKLVIGGALLVATQAVVRRYTSARGDDDEENDQEIREETPPIVDRRMTILLNEPPVKEIPKKSSLEMSAPVSYDLFRKTPIVIKSAPTPKQLSVEEEEVEEEEPAEKSEDEKELHSEDDEVIEEEEEEQEPIKEVPKQTAPPLKEAKKVVIVEATDEGDDEDVGEDVEIIDEEDIEEEEEEDVSDVDDTELLSRLEAKYGRLPEPERPGQRHKDGGNTMEDYWPEEPSNPHWHQQLEEAERELLQGRYEAALVLARQPELQKSARARWTIAQALDKMAEAKRDNRILTQAITAYLELLKMNEKLPNKTLLKITERTLNRMKFRGVYLSMEPVYKLLIRRFPNDVSYRNNLTVSLLMADRTDLAETVLKETLRKWPHNKVALVHYAFILKNQHKKYEEAVEAFKVALKGDEGPACEPRFYHHYGDALLLLGRFAEAHEVHRRAAAHGHFLSPMQRSLYNVKRLKSKPWWNIEQTPYARLARALEKSWKAILKEGQAMRALYQEEKEGLRERGEWSQLDIFVRGQEIPGRCERVPVTCSIIRDEVGASPCRRGQIKFSLMEAGTHVRPHVGPTNCRLRMHLGLSNTKDTFLRVDKEIRQWQEGKVFLFDDSFEHEVWHNGTGSRLVLIMDVWHPDLTPAERRELPAI